MRTYHNINKNMRFKQIYSDEHVNNKLVGCSSALQPESFAIGILENHFYTK